MGLKCPGIRQRGSKDLILRRNEQGMTYYEAALRVLKFAGYPLTAREITDQAIEAGLIAPVGKTPYSTMSSILYKRLKTDLELLKMEDPGKGRAKPGSVRWMAVSRLQCS